MSDLETSINENAQGPKSASGDIGSVTEHSLKDQIEADKYLKNTAAVRKRGLGLRLLKITPGSTVGGD